MMYNIVQAEFFHVGGVDSSLQQLKIECEERVQIGAPLKTTVRFFDEGGFVTEYVKQYQFEASIPSKLLSEYKNASSLRKYVLATLLQCAYAKTSLPQERLFKAQDAFLAIAETSRIIALECTDRSFRLLKDDELYDMKTAVSKAKTAWLFVFTHNDLCAEKNVLIASAF